MKPGLCHGCGAKIGRISANGYLTYLPSMRQVAAIFSYDNCPHDGEARTELHLPVCLDCSTNFDWDQVKELLKSTPEVVEFLKNPLKPVYSGFKLDPVMGGKRRLDA